MKKCYFPQKASCIHHNSEKLSFLLTSRKTSNCYIYQCLAITYNQIFIMYSKLETISMVYYMPLMLLFKVPNF